MDRNAFTYLSTKMTSLDWETLEAADRIANLSDEVMLTTKEAALFLRVMFCHNAAAPLALSSDQMKTHAHAGVLRSAQLSGGESRGRPDPV